MADISQNGTRFIASTRKQCSKHLSANVQKTQAEMILVHLHIIFQLNNDPFEKTWAESPNHYFTRSINKTIDRLPLWDEFISYNNFIDNIWVGSSEMGSKVWKRVAGGEGERACVRCRRARLRSEHRVAVTSAAHPASAACASPRASLLCDSRTARARVVVLYDGTAWEC